MSSLNATIRAFVIDTFLFGQDNGLTDDSSFLDQGIVDSTGVLELIAYVEQTHGIKVKDEELIPDNLDSIAAIAAFIERKQSET